VTIHADAPAPGDPPAVPTAPEAAAPGAGPRESRHGSGRTGRLMAAAAVLGLLAGAGAGYAVQSRRDPTPLPPLRAERPVYPAARTNKAPEVFPTDGDLRPFLLKKPKGASGWPAGHGAPSWTPIEEVAAPYGRPDRAFVWLNKDEFRRGATVRWRESSGLVVVIRLLQFREEGTSGAADYFRSQDGTWAQEAGYGDSRLSRERLSGTLYGVVYRSLRPITGADMPLYGATALARHGDLVVDILLYSPHPISSSTIDGIAERQWGRL
jgi:hypothetical protein